MSDHKKKMKPTRRFILVMGISLTLLVLVMGGYWLVTKKDAQPLESQSSSDVTDNFLAPKRKKEAMKKKKSDQNELKDDVALSVLDHFQLEPLTTDWLGSESVDRTELLQVQQLVQMAYKEDEREPENKQTNEKETKQKESEKQGASLPEPRPDSEPEWKAPSLSPTVQVIVVGQGADFTPLSYFTIDYGSDFKPIITISPIDTSILGTQLVMIVLEDCRGNQAKLSIPVVVNASPVLSLTESQIEVPIGSDFDYYQLISATDYEEGNLLSQVSWTTNLDCQHEGSYTVNYQVADSYGFTDSITLIVHVTNQAPVIQAKAVEHELNQPFDPLASVTVNDREDGKIELNESHVLMNTVDITTEGTYDVTIGKVTDKYGKSAETLTYKVTVVNEAPQISNEHYQIPMNSAFDLETYLSQLRVTDREDDKLNLPVKVVADEVDVTKIDTTVAGSYEIKLTATDSNGKETMIIGIIDVSADKLEMEGEESEGLLLFFKRK